MGHTPEHYSVRSIPHEGSPPDYFVMEGDKTAALIINAGGQAQSRARRIAACVNACKDIPTDVLEANTVKELITMATAPNAVETEALIATLREIYK